MYIYHNIYVYHNIYIHQLSTIAMFMRCHNDTNCHNGTNKGDILPTIWDISTKKSLISIRWRGLSWCGSISIKCDNVPNETIHVSRYYMNLYKRNMTNDIQSRHMIGKSNITLISYRKCTWYHISHGKSLHNLTEKPWIGFNWCYWFLC